MLSVSRRVAYIPLVGLLLSACGSQAAPAPGSPEAAIQPIAAVPTAAPRPTDTPVPAPTPTATPKPEPRSPLTGLPASQADMARRPLLVKIGNSEAERPQSGLSLADVVYESVTEGGITRYAAVFQSQETGTIGPVRSARLSDLQIAPEFDAVLAHVGASSPVMDLLHANSLLDLDQFFNLQYYHRTTDRVAPYNVYTSTASLRAGALAHGFAPTAEVAPYVFEDTAHDGVSAGSIDFDFAKQTHVRYVYDVAQHDYHQMEYDAATIDAATRKPVNIKNLVVQLTPVQTTDIVED
ncbi:MAG TPA: DUF3048 domain-containing protein, partial [Chloroflexota bacterium]